MPMDKQTLEARMRAAIPTTAELRADVEEAVDPPPKPDPKAQRVYTFDFDHRSPGGRVWKGVFQNHVLSLRERQLVGVLRAKMSGGMPSESLDPLTQEINLMLAHLEYSLEKRPEWAKDLSKVEDLEMVQALYAEVAAHEATFLGWGKAASSGEGQP